MPNDRRRIYLVDDNAIDGVTLPRIIEHACPGWEVTRFEHASAALEAVRVTAPDLLLTDYQLPGIDGIEMAKIIRELGFTFPIVALSAAPPDLIHNKAPEGLFNLVLGKPPSDEALVQLRALLG